VAKVITIAAGLNEVVITPQTTFIVPSAKKFYDLVLHDADPHPTVPYTVSDILAKSSNIGTIFVSQKIGTQKQENYMRAFGLGEQTALAFPGEARGLLKPSLQWHGTENVTVAYGQGVAATAIQLVSAVNAIANGGVYVAPKLVDAVIAPDGSQQPTLPSATRRVVSAQVAEQMNLMMRDVVCSGTAKGFANVAGYTIAGKTGTGYKAQPNGTYLDAQGNHAYYASFVGFLPAEDPQITILVSIDQPPANAQHFGANTAAPVFAQIASSAIVDLGIQPPTANGGCPTRQRVGA
jgi:cell division protein FtsI (penicillin-binding protein 3)